jgi:hypothetical protein
MVLYSKFNIKNIVFKISTQNRCVQEIEKKFDGQMEVCYMGFCKCDYLAGFRKRKGVGYVFWDDM